MRKNNWNKYTPEENFGICVVKKRGEPTEDLMRRFKKKVSKSGIIREAKEKMRYEKPSDRKRRKRAQSLRLIMKERLKAEKLKEKNRRHKRKKKKEQEAHELANKENNIILVEETTI